MPWPAGFMDTEDANHDRSSSDQIAGRAALKRLLDVEDVAAVWRS